MKLRSLLLFAGISGLVLSGGVLAGCSGAAGSDDGDDPGVDGKLEQVPDQLTGTSAAGPIATPGSATEVWAATNAWSDKSSAAAQAAGVAWEANSGLDWSQKFSAWIASFKQIPNADGSGTTVQIPTPFGDRTLPGPTLECAEFGMMLRVTFASWYHLPFYLTGWDAAHKRTLYAGSFGFVSSSGAGVAGFPKYKAQYKDYEPSWKAGDAWPTDSNLDKIHLAGGSGDNNEFLGSDDSTNGAGAYFDQLFLNKRAAYFMRNLLDYFGSINLADSSNLIQVKAESIQVGDVMLERWQKEGIGHTIPIMAVTPTVPGHIAISAASGSMPRRQPLWEGNDDLVYTFTGDYTGGPSMSGDNVPYSHLGGGLHRWRTAVNRGGHWTNERSGDDIDAYIAAGDYPSIEARPLKFQTLMSNGSPESQRDAALAAINDARTKLHSHPSSCSARTERENAFQSLYAIEQSAFSTNQADVDKQYRTLEDQVFSELDYTKSKTCCWDSTTDAMGALILQYAQNEQDQASADGVCKQPTVFEAEASSGDGYKRWADYAASQNQSSAWVNWSQDEPCAQAGVAQDTVTPRGTIAWCPR